MRVRRSIAAAALVWVAACGAGACNSDDSPVESGDVTRGGDARQKQPTAALRDEGFRVDRRRVLRPSAITPFDEIFPGGLYRPSAMQSSADGLICVADTGNHRVFLLDGELEILAEAGAEGDGPGEFRQLTQCAVGDRGEILALDTRHSRLTRFDASGGLLQTYQLPMGTSPAAALLPDGAIVSAGLDLRAVTITPLAGEKRQIALPETDCRGTARGMGRIWVATAPDGRRGILARTSDCEDSDHTLVARVDLVAGAAVVYPLTVFDEFRPKRPPRLKGRGTVSRLVLYRPAVAPTRAFFLHGGVRRVAGLGMSALDVWDLAGGDLVRLYIGVEAQRSGLPRLTLMTPTPGGDLLVVDDSYETIFRIDENDIAAALAAAEQE